MSEGQSEWHAWQQDTIRLVLEDRRTEYDLAFHRSEPTRVIASLPARIQRNSVLFEYAVTFPRPHQPVVLVAKIPKRGHPNDNAKPDMIARARAQQRTEWEELSRAYVHFARRANGLRVVRPVGYIESCHALLSEKASGHELAKTIGTGGAGEMRALARAGRWLAIFHHGLHEASNREWTPLWYATCLDERRIRFLSLSTSRGHWEPLLERVLTHAQGCSPRLVPHSMLHGDFRLRHIWATSEGIEVLDLGNAHEGDCYADVAALVVELMMLQLGRPFVSRRLVDAQIRAFTDAYFSGEPPSIFWFYVIDRLFKKWGRWMSRWNSPTKDVWWAATVQQCVQLFRGTRVTNQMYVSRWFGAHILETLARAR
jgi:hypothetical protein